MLFSKSVGREIFFRANTVHLLLSNSIQRFPQITHMTSRTHFGLDARENNRICICLLFLVSGHVSAVFCKAKNTVVTGKCVKSSGIVQRTWFDQTAKTKAVSKRV